MVRCCVLLLVGTAAAVAVATPAALAEPARPTAIRLGILSGMFRDVPPGVVHAASSPFRDLFKRQTGLEGEVEVVDDHDTLAAKMQDKDLHFGVFHGFEYAWVMDRYPDLQPLVVSVPNGRRVQAVLVVNVKSDAKSPADLKGACVTVPAGTKAHCHLFLERLCETLPNGCCCPVGPRELSPEEALDGVAANRFPAALVDIGSLVAYQNNKPGAATQVKVLAESEPFPPGVVVYRKDAIDPATLAKVRSGLLSAHQNAQGKAMMMLWKLKGFEEPPASFETDMRRICKAYPPPAAR